MQLDLEQCESPWQNSRLIFRMRCSHISQMLAALKDDKVHTQDMALILHTARFVCILRHMQRYIRLAMALMLAIILPLQVVAAYAMPLCADMQDTPQAMVMADEVDHASMGCEHAEQARPQDDSSKQQPGHQCDKCFACYLAVAQAVTPFTIAVGDYGSAATLPPVVDRTYLTVPAPPFHPPRHFQA